MIAAFSAYRTNFKTITKIWFFDLLYFPYSRALVGGGAQPLNRSFKAFGNNRFPFALAQTRIRDGRNFSSVHET